MIRFYPSLENLKLLDYKVRILTPGEGTRAVTRVMIESSDGSDETWSTIGVSANVIDASFIALNDSITYKLIRDRAKSKFFARSRQNLMAGTNKTRKGASVAFGPQPAIILVEPQLGENIGAAARAMLNCGLTQLRLVNPRDGWPNERAVASASGADQVLDRATIYSSTEDAIADLQHVFATTARERDMTKPVATPRQAARAMRRFAAKKQKFGVLFGPERRGSYQ